MGAPPSVFSLVGPGDPLADPQRTLDTVRALRAIYPDVPVSLFTCGLGAAELAEELALAGVAQVGLAVSTRRAGTCRAFHNWIRPAKRNLHLDEACPLLLRAQDEALAALTGAGIAVKVDMVLAKGVNEDEAGEVAAWAAKGGACAMAVHPARSGEGEADPGPEALETAKAEAARHIDLMEPDFSHDSGREPLAPDESTLYDASKPCLAVASSDASAVDTHLGQAEHLLIYELVENMITLREKRTAPPRGGGDRRWQTLAETLADCRAVVVASAGENPARVLGRNGVPVLVAPGPIESAAARVFGVTPNAGKLPKSMR
jgi:nitrogen fixation protein NifB